MATIALTVGRQGAHELAVVGERALHRHLPAVGRRRPGRRAAGRPALPQAARGHRRPGPARRLRRAAVRRQRGRDHRPRGGRRGSPTRSSGPRCWPASRTSSPRPSSRTVRRCSRRPTGRRRRSGRFSAASSPAHRARTSSTGSTPPRSLSQRCCCFRIPARLLQSEQAISRGHWRDLGEGLARLPAFRRDAHGALSPSASPMLARRADQRHRDLPRRARAASRPVRLSACSGRRAVSGS